MKTLRVAPDLAFPVDFATEGIGVVGMRGSGKTNLEVRWCEVLYKAKIPFVVVDPKGDWGGIRSSADGKSPGLPIPVFGGLYGDFPLDETLGRRIADLLVDENMSAVLDVSRLSHAARARFLTDFFEQLMDRHQREPHVRCVILEEAHRYIPQQVPSELTRVKEAASSILLEGRAWGLGCWAATQRPARLNKDVMEEVGTIIVFRLGVAATNDQRTVKGWFKDEEQGPEIGRSLTKLKNGQGWVHAPHTLGIIQCVQFDRRTTFDSAATPLVGASGRPIATMADINSEAITQALTDAIQRAKDNDPRELKKQLDAARTELGKRPTVEDVAELEWWRRFSVKFAPDQLPPVGSPFTSLGPLYLSGAPAPPTKVPYVPESVVEARDRVVESAHALATVIRDMSTLVDHAVKDTQRQTPRPKSTPAPAELATVRHLPPPRPVTESSTSSAEIPQGELRLLVAIAERPDGATQSQLVILSRYKKSSVKTYLGRLRNRGYITSNGQRFVATDAGRAALPADLEPLPTGSALRAHWLNDLPDGEARILTELIAAYPHTLDRRSLRDRTNYQESSVKTYVTRLKARELVVIDDGEPRASAVLFDNVEEVVGG